MREWRALAIGLVVLGACAGSQRTIVFPENHLRLTNGMQVVVLSDATTDLVEVDVRYLVGSREDPPGKAGLAHLVEHLMFQQRQAGPDAPPIGAMFRQLAISYNAYTNWDTTHYMTLAPSARLEDLVALEVARLVTGCDTIDADTFAREREVVRNEIRTRLGTPEAQVDYLLLEELYPKAHPYRQMVGGDDEQLAAITLDDVCKFMRDYYVPERATFLLAGNVTAEQGRALVDRVLGPISARRGAPRADVATAAVRPGTVEHELPVEETSVFAAWALPPAHSDDFDAAAAYLGELAGRAARFGDVYEFATDVSIHIIGGEASPMVVLQVSVAEPGQVDEAKAAIARAAGGLRKRETASKGDLHARLTAGVVTRLESLPSRTQVFGDFAQFRGYRHTLPDEIERLRRFDLDRVARVGRKVLDPDKARYIVVRPKEGVPPRLRRAALKYSATTGDSQRDELPIDRSEAASAINLPPHATALAFATAVTLANGMRVVLVPAGKGLPVVTIALRFGAGSAHEPADQAGLAAAASDFLFGVAGWMQIANVGGMVASNVDAEGTTFYVRGLSYYLDELLRGLERYIAEGEYNQDDVEGWERRQRHALKRASIRAEDAFSRATLASLFGAGHPYARTGDPTMESLDDIGRDALMRFKDRHYVARNATLVVVGNFDTVFAEAAVRARFSDWKEGAADGPLAAPTASSSGPRFEGVVGEHMEMVPVTVSFPLARAVDDDYPVRLVVAEMLSQRVRAVREKLGASYGVGARLLVYQSAGAYVIRGSVDPERAGDALRVIRDAVAALRRGDGLIEDFVRARRRVLSVRLADATSSLELALRASWLVANQRPLTFEDDVLERVARLTPQDALRVIVRELPAEREAVVVMGKRPVLDRTFAGAGITSPTFASEK